MKQCTLQVSRQHDRSLRKAALIAIWALSCVGPARAASPEAAYFAARDAYIAQFEAIAMSEKHQQALDELTKLLRPIIGPVALKGFSAEGTISLTTLGEGDLGFGLLDGLRYSSADDKAYVVVTTEPMLKHWLRDHKDWNGDKYANVPQSVGAALRSEEFYAQAVRIDAAIVRYVALPVTQPAKAKVAFAMLVARTQSDIPPAPDEIIVSLAQGGRVFVVSAPAAVTIDPIPACQKVRQDIEQKLSETFDEKLQADGDAAFLRCFARRAKAHTFFPAATKQAQEIIDALPH